MINKCESRNYQFPLTLTLSRSISMCIYSPIPITEQIRKSFKPCRLYIKELAGMKYLGKTSRDPYKYTGSGVIWRDRIKKYGKEHIKTLWVSDWFYDPQLIHSIAISISNENKIVESNEWANLKPEDGLTGGRPGKGRKQPGAGKKSWETKLKAGTPKVGTPDSYKQGTRTKRENGIFITPQLNTLAAKEKARNKCNRLASRKIVTQLRELAAGTKTRLGSGWVRKPDHWILTKLTELSSCHNATA